MITWGKTSSYLGTDKGLIPWGEMVKERGNITMLTISRHRGNINHVEGFSGFVSVSVSTDWN